MNRDWKTIDFLESIKKISNTRKIPKKSFLDNGIYPIVSQENELINGYWDKKEDIFNVNKAVIIFGDHTKKLKYIDFDFVMGADGVKILLPIDKIDSKFYYYQLQSFEIKDLGYARHYRLLKEYKISYPLLEEQKQIVEILDKAFESIEQAKANIEKNIQNSQELFQSRLNEIFSQKGEGWEEKTFDEVLEIKSGKNQKEVLSENGEYPILGSAGKVMGYANKYICDEYTTIIGRKGTINNPMLIKEKFWNVDTAFGLHAKEILNKKYLFYFCKNFDFTKLDKGSGRPSLVKTDLLKIKIPIIGDKTLQSSIVKNLDKLSKQTKQLEKHYNQKLKNLEELKKSILQKAFSGELLN